MAASPRVAMVAGETSGDLLAGLLIDGMQAHWPDLQTCGIGGPQMQRRGFDAWWPSEKLAVHGYSMEVLRRLRELLGIRKQLRERLLKDRPDVFIGVDAPDFNLGLEADLRAAGIKTVHFVCPSIWAWRAERVEKIRRSADHVLCIFPFEPELLARHGIAATYVGHPLAGVIPMVPDRAAARAQLGLQDTDEVLAILPGSRSSEIAYITQPFFEAAALVRKARPAIKLIVPAVPALRDRIVQGALRHVLEPIFEAEFAGQSYGFRPGRGAKDALRRVEFEHRASVKPQTDPLNARADTLQQGPQLFSVGLGMNVRSFGDPLPPERGLRITFGVPSPKQSALSVIRFRHVERLQACFGWCWRCR